MSKKSCLEALLDDDEWGWLTTSAAEARLPDEGKAFRCCVNFLAQAPAGARAVELLRAAAALREAGAEQKMRKLGLAGSQMEWMRSASAQHGLPSPESFASTVVRACMQLDDSAAIFGVIRCKTATACRGDADVAGLADASTSCAGAQEALAAQTEVDASSSTVETGSTLTFRTATAADRERTIETINAAYMEEAFVKMPFAEQRISVETFDAAVANESGKTVWHLPIA